MSRVPKTSEIFEERKPSPRTADACWVVTARFHVQTAKGLLGVVRIRSYIGSTPPLAYFDHEMLEKYFKPVKTTA